MYCMENEYRTVQAQTSSYRCTCTCCDMYVYSRKLNALYGEQVPHFSNAREGPIELGVAIKGVELLARLLPLLYREATASWSCSEMELCDRCNLIADCTCATRLNFSSEDFDLITLECCISNACRRFSCRSWAPLTGDGDMTSSLKHLASCLRHHCAHAPCPGFDWLKTVLLYYSYLCVPQYLREFGILELWV